MAHGLQITKLQKRKGRLRMAIMGPTGSGKTFTSMLLMRHIIDPGDRILVIDSEHESAGLYEQELNHDDRFDTINLPDHNPDTYVQALELAKANGYKGVVIDSLSHAWMGKEGALEQVDKKAKKSQSNNSFAAWRDVTPMHNRLVEAMLSYPGHLVVTMRSKTEYIIEQTGGGKSAPRKVGMAPVQRDGVEYEFDICADMDYEQNFIVSKTRMSALKGIVIHEPGEKLAIGIREWLEGGMMDARMIMQEIEAVEDDKRKLASLAKQKGVRLASFMEARWAEGCRTIADFFLALRELPDAEEDEGQAEPSAAAEPPSAEEAAKVVAEAIRIFPDDAEAAQRAEAAPPEDDPEPTPMEFLEHLIGGDVLELWTKSLKACGGDVKALAAECQEHKVRTSGEAKAFYQAHRKAAASQTLIEIDESEKKTGAAS